MNENAGLDAAMLEARKRPHIQAAIRECLVACAAHREKRLSRQSCSVEEKGCEDAAAFSRA